MKHKSQKLKPKLKRRASSTFERTLLQKGYSRVVGIDEVGRGAWAGPVVVGGYAFSASIKETKGVNDSKLLSAEQREFLVKSLRNHEHFLVTGELNDVNAVGVGKTIEHAIAEIVKHFDDGATYFLIDGHFARNFGSQTEQIIKGDRKHYAIAAASVLAKVYRDGVMKNLHKLYPDYGFNRNVGYGTAFHRSVIKLMGVCPLHRTSFNPIKLRLEQTAMELELYGE